MNIEFFVPGNPQPQGSIRAFVRGGKPVLTSDNPALADWRTMVHFAASAHFARLIDGGVGITARFVMPRTKSLPKSRETRLIKRPDLDKLARGLMDALTGVVYADDSEVWLLHVTKRYAMAGEQPGVQVEVRW